MSTSRCQCSCRALCDCISQPGVLLGAVVLITRLNSIDISSLFLVCIYFSFCILPAVLQDDGVYKSMTARDKVALWEQGLCPGSHVSDHLLQLMLLATRIAQCSCHMLQCEFANCCSICWFGTRCSTGQTCSYIPIPVAMPVLTSACQRTPACINNLVQSIPACTNIPVCKHFCLY